MATSKEIEDIIGVPAKTIDTWSRTRDDRYLLAKFLKSFSKYDLIDKIDAIAKSEGFKIVDIGELIETINEYVDSILPLSKTEIIDSKINIGSKTGASDLMVKTKNSIYFFDYVSQLPSKTIIERRCKNTTKTILETDNEYLSGIKNVNFIYITTRKIKNGEISTIIDRTDEYEVRVMDIDTLAKKVFNEDKIIVKN